MRQGQSFRLYRHQEEAVRKGLASQHFVVTSGTGSGKTLTYFLPIFDAVLRGNPEQAKRLGHRRLPDERPGQLAGGRPAPAGRAATRARTGKPMPVRFAKYTGQESG